MPANSENAEYIKRLLRPRYGARVLMCIIGAGTYTSNWVNWEIWFAKREGKGLVGVRPYPNSPSCPSEPLRNDLYNSCPNFCTPWRLLALPHMLPKDSKPPYANTHVVGLHSLTSDVERLRRWRLRVDRVSRGTHTRSVALRTRRRLWAHCTGNPG